MQPVGDVTKPPVVMFEGALYAKYRYLEPESNMCLLQSTRFASKHSPTGDVRRIPATPHKPSPQPSPDDQPIQSPVAYSNQLPTISHFTTRAHHAFAFPPARRTRP
jgi:hypothetical protein